MVNVIGVDNQSEFVVHYYKNDGKSIVNDKMECWIHESKTVCQYIRNVSMFYGLDVHSFYLKFKAYESNCCTAEIKIKDKLMLVVGDNSLLSSYGIVFGKDFQYHFILSMNDHPEENDDTQCFVRIPKECKVYVLTVGKNKTGSQFYKQVLQLCQNDNFNTDYLVLTYNFYKVHTSSELVKLKITEDDTRLLSDIGVIFGKGIKNCFEISLNNLSDNVNKVISSKLCLPMQDQKTERQCARMYSLVQKNPVLSTIPRLISHRLTEISSKNTEYRGLVNQALTCYLNSLLQALYMTPEFRNALYSWKSNFHVNLNESKSILFQLQKLFLNLQTSPWTSVETKELTDSFGWNSNEVWQQHDIQEFCTYMFDTLEKEFRNTTHVDLIRDLYQGELIDNVKCLECGMEKSRVDKFLNICLSIRPDDNTNAYTSIIEALQGFIQQEKLEETNQYYCAVCNKKCDAHKRLKFNKLPYILILHLKRFSYDKKTFNYFKLNDKVEIPLILNLNSFVPSYKNKDKEDALIDEYFEEISDNGSMYYNTENGSSSVLNEINQNEEKNIDQHMDEDECAKSLNLENEPIGPYMYELYAIMIHSGNASGGHYYAYVKDLKTNQWLCFNDQIVSEITMDDIEKIFGGEPINEYSNQYGNNAYMVMYRQIDQSRNKIAMTQEEFPPHLKDLQKILQQKFEYDNKLQREKEQYTFKVPVQFMKNNLKMLFDCNRITTVDQLKTMAMKYYGVTEPCHLVIFDKIKENIVENLKHRGDCFVYELKYNLSCGLLLQIEADESFLLTSKNIIMKLLIINLDDNVEDINVSRTVDITVEQNTVIEDLSNLLKKIYFISNESILHFAIENSLGVSILLKQTVECSSVNTNCVFVFIEHRVNTKLDNIQKMKYIIKQYNTSTYTIQLQFVLPPKNTDMIQHLMDSSNNNSINSEGKLMPSSEDLNRDIIDDCNMLVKDNRLVTSHEDLCIADVGNKSPHLGENSIIDNERKIIKDVEDTQINSTVFEHDLIKVYDHDRLDKNNKDEKEDKNDNNNELQSNNKYIFLILDFKPVSDAECKNDYSTFNALVDRRMTVNELKNHLVSHINIQSNNIILNRYISENELEELALPSRSIEDLTNHEIIYISTGVALHDDQYRGTIFSIESLEQSQIFMKKMFDWIITVGTSVLDTKKELIVKLKETHNVDIPLERCRLRRKKKSAILQCYFNEEIWYENIGQGWEMVILDLKDRSELELDKTKRHMFVYRVEVNDFQQCKITEMEFFIEITLMISVTKQLVKEISTKCNLPEDQIQLGYLDEHSTNITWKTNANKWSFEFFDYINSVIYFRFVDKATTIKETSSK